MNSTLGSRFSALALVGAMVLGAPAIASAETFGGGASSGSTSKASPSYRPSKVSPVSASPSGSELKPVKNSSGGWRTAKGPLTGNERSIPIGGGYRAHFGLPVNAVLKQGNSGRQETTNRTYGIARGMKVDTYNGSTTPTKGIAVSSSKSEFSTGRTVNGTRTVTMGTKSTTTRSTSTR